MPRPRFNKLKEEKKKAIFGAALEEFAKNGFEGASYNRIIEKSGISKGAMYYYFDDKLDLFVSLIHHEVHETVDAFGELPEVSSASEFWGSMSEMMTYYHKFVIQEPLKMQLLKAAWNLKLDGDIDPILKECLHLAYDFSAKVILAGQKVGAIRKDLPFELLVQYMTAIGEVGDTWVLDHFDEFDGEGFKKWLDSFVDILYRVLSPHEVIPYEKLS